MSWLEIVGSVLGVFGVILMIRQHLLAWPVGLVQVAVYAWVFYAAKLYSDVILQGVFFALLAFGWWRWSKGTETGGVRVELPVTRVTPLARVGYVVAGVVGALAWGEFMRRTTDADFPYWDAAVLSFSLLSQWLQARKKIENWMGWMLVNVIAVGLYFAKALYLTAGLYTVFFGLAVAGYVSWRRDNPEVKA